MGKMRRWRRHSLEFKREAVERMRSCESIDALARELDIQRKLLYTWRYQFEGHPERRHANYGITAEERKEKRLVEEIGRVKAALADKVLENDFLKSALFRINEERQRSSGLPGSASTPRSGRGRKSKAN